MTLLVKIGSITTPASTGDQAYTGVGFEPKAIIFNTVRSTAADTQVGANGNGGGAGIGFTDGTNQFSLGNGLVFPSDNPFRNATLFYTDHCIHAMSDDNGVRFSASIVSMDSDGFTLNWDVVQTGMLVYYVALGGDIEAHVGSFDLPTSGSTVSETGCGFTPSALMMLHGWDGTDGTIFNDAEWGVGWAASPAQRGAFVYGAQAGGGATNKHEGLFTDCVTIGTDPTVVSIDWEADLQSFDDDGFTLSISNSPSATITHGYLALSGVTARAGAETFTGTGNEVVTGIGITPEFVMLHSLIDDSRSHDSLLSNAGFWANGFATEDEEASLFYDIGGGSFNNGVWYSANAALKSFFFAEEFVLSMTSFDTDGFTMDIVSNSGSATRPYAWFALGPEDFVPQIVRVR